VLRFIHCEEECHYAECRGAILNGAIEIVENVLLISLWVGMHVVQIDCQIIRTYHHLKNPSFHWESGAYPVDFLCNLQMGPISKIVCS
jgi:hypothetical protein